MNRKIFFLSVGRSDFLRQKSIFEAIKLKKNIDYKILISGSHKSKGFGETITEIKKSNLSFIDCTIKKYFFDKRKISSNIYRSSYNIDRVISIHKPDIFVTFGDRYEMLSGAIACFGKKIILVHIHGGSVTEGSFDDIVRHTLTKLSHFHYTSIKQYADRIIQMGEEKNKIKIVGAPGIDYIKEYSKNIVPSKIKKFTRKKYLLLCFHSETNVLEKLENQLDCLEYIIKNININFVITYPNSDPGCIDIINKFKKIKKLYPKKILLIKNADQAFYYLLKNCRILIGNSSSGIVEAATFSKKTINLGSRQKGKLIPKHVINCDFNKHKLKKIILSNLKKNNKKNFFKNPYGDGNAGKKIANLLCKIDLKNRYNYIKKFRTIKC